MGFVEYSLVSLITLAAVVVLWRSWWKDEKEIFSPRVIFTVMILYYTVVGPLFLAYSDDVWFLGVNMRPVLWKGWVASAVAYLSFLGGYAKSSRMRMAFKVQTQDSSVLFVALVFVMITAVGMLYWLGKYGGGWRFLNPLYDADVAEVLSSSFDAVAAVYILQLINMTFGAAILLMLYALDRRSTMAAWLFVGVVVGSGLFFLKTGFRYRIAWMAMALVWSYHLWCKKRPNLLFWSPMVLIFVGLMGLVGATRTYWTGLSMDRAEGMHVTDYLIGGMAESATFLTLSQVIDAVPSKFPHTLLDPIWVAITYPIPRSWWPDKPTSRTLDTLISAFGTSEASGAGQAVPYFGEWYVALGWPGIIVSSFVFGRVSKYLWEWFNRHERDKIAVVIYGVGIGFMYVAFSRGLFAQAFLNFCFSLLPLIIVYRWMPKIMVLARLALPKNVTDLEPVARGGRRGNPNRRQ